MKMVYTRTITHSASGAKCVVHDFGATVISFQTGAGRECLFVSRDAKKDGSKAIRGGIPLVFPQFGQPDKSMPQHGFLRSNFWKVDESSAFDNETEAGIRFSLDLKDVKNARGGAWDENTEFDCTCVYSIKINGSQMTTILEVRNTGRKAFDFQTLQHTYLRVEGKSAQDPEHCYVKGLEGYKVVDKITDTEYTWEEKLVTIPENVDRVYNPLATQSGGELSVTVGVGENKIVKLTGNGLLDGAPVPVSCVVWNPYKEKAAEMGDFGDDEYVDMICVEPGLLSGLTLESGKVGSLTQIIEMV